MMYDPHPIERGRVVRVRLPRAALAAFGLPVNEQQAEQPIRADVVLGEDGLAAIAAATDEQEKVGSSARVGNLLGTPS